MADDDTAIPFLATTTNTTNTTNDDSNSPNQQQPMTMDENIKHICTEVGIPNKSRLKLVVGAAGAVSLHS